MTVDELIAIFNEVLETEQASADANFFELGGDSLIGTRVLSAIARASGLELEFGDLVQAPTPRELAEETVRVSSS